MKDYRNNDKRIEKNVRIADKNVVSVEKKVSKKIKAVKMQDTIEGKGVEKMRKANVRNGVITWVRKTKVILAVGRELEIVVDC